MSSDFPSYVGPASKEFHLARNISALVLTERLQVIIGGAIPMLFVSYTSAPFVNFVHLALPVSVRRSREQALQYAKQLPPTATLYINTMKFTTIPRQTQVRLGDLVPDKSKLRPIPHTKLIFSSTPSFSSLYPQTPTLSTSNQLPPSARMNAQKGKQGTILGLTPNDAKLVLLGVLYTSNDGKVEFEKFMSNGYKNTASAYSAYRQAKRKLFDANTTSGDASSTAVTHVSADTAHDPTANRNPVEETPKKTPTKRKKAAVTAAVDEDISGGNAGGEAPSVPPKKRAQRTPAEKKVVAKKEDDVGGDNDENTNTTPSKKVPQNLESSTAPDVENE
ncbi:hypothetical protein BJX63DRAFT_431456 [Aspergillus granulosus]|uniref:Uncharacterized protein n=1 Tax=Aspergillus granulosus TaxID=176169 RepID=A0ABR4HFW0_9EURO